MSAALYLPCMYASFSAIALLRSLISDNATNRLLIGGLQLLSGQSPDASPLLHPTNGIGRDRRVKELIWQNKNPARPVFLSFFFEGCFCRLFINPFLLLGPSPNLLWPTTGTRAPPPTKGSSSTMFALRPPLHHPRRRLMLPATLPRERPRLAAQYRASRAGAA